MDNIIFYAVSATVISLVVASLLIFLIIQRRRHRAMQLLAMAQEDAERRRRNRKKVGLRRWEIDSVSPEAVFTHTSQISSPVLYKLQDKPAEYISAISHLPRPQPVSEPHPVHPVHHHTDVPPQAIVLPDQNHTCVICLDDLVISQNLRALPCQHVYHAQCIRVWLRRKNACPCCCEKVIKRRRKKPHSTQLAPVRPVRLSDRAENTAHESSQKAFSEDVEASFDRFNSEASIQQDELSAAQLLFQVRKALRGESSTISLNTSVADQEEALTCRSVPDVPSFGCSSIDPEERDNSSNTKRVTLTADDQQDPDSMLIEEKPDEVVIDLGSTTSSEFLTPPPERLFLDEQPVQSEV